MLIVLKYPDEDGELHITVDRQAAGKNWPSFKVSFEVAAWHPGETEHEALRRVASDILARS